MQKKKTVTGLVTRVERVGRTIYGNPIMRVAIQSLDASQIGIYLISNDAGLVYEIANPEFETEPHTFVLTPAGRISHRLAAGVTA